jgi:hypothetical protein
VARLRRTYSSGAASPDFDRRKLGPAYSWCGEGVIRVSDGRLEGMQFGVVADNDLGEAVVRLHCEGVEAGYCRFCYSAADSTVRLVDVRVVERLRRGGLASLLVRFGFRLALDSLTSARCSIRMPHVNGHWNETKSSGAVGVCLIARALGFSPEYSIAALVRADNITTIQQIEVGSASPPVYRLTLRSFPSVMTVLFTEKDGRTVCPADHWMHEFPVAPATMEHWVNAGQLLALNGDYLLRRDGIERMVSYIADGEVDAGELRCKLRASGANGR